MAQTYTLDEAAGKLGIGVDEFKRRLRDQWKHIRSLRDGSTLRFKSNEIDELARTAGQDHIDLEPGDATRVAPSAVKSKRPPSDDDIPLILDSGPDMFLPDLPPTKGGTDSDVRLEKSGRSKQVKQDHTEEISLELPPASKGGSIRLGSTAKLGGLSGKMPKPTPKDRHDESEFELTLETDSDEFELSLNPDSASEEIDLASLPRKTSGPRSGINIGRPADSGISLERSPDRSKKKPASSEDIEFEVNLEPNGQRSSRNLKNDSDSEFELNLDESSESHDALDGEKGDIFETDFELPALDDDSASEVHALDESADSELENSDFDLAIEGVESDSDSAENESASEVVEIDEEDAPKARKGKAKKLKGDDDDGGISFDDMDLDDSISASRALRGVKGDDDAIMVDDDGGTYAATGAAGAAMVAAAAPWGVLPVVLLIPCMFLMFLGGLMGYELLHSMWGYQQPSKPAGMLVEGVAKIFGVEPKE